MGKNRSNLTFLKFSDLNFSHPGLCSKSRGERRTNGGEPTILFKKRLAIEKPDKNVLFKAVLFFSLKKVRHGTNFSTSSV